MTHHTQDADKIKALEALEALDKLRDSANGYNSLLKTGESWDLDEIIRTALTTPAPQSEKVEVVTVDEMLAIAFSTKNFDTAVIPDALEGARECIREIILRFPNGVKIITKEPNDGNN